MSWVVRAASEIVEDLKTWSRVGLGVARGLYLSGSEKEVREIAGIVQGLLPELEIKVGKVPGWWTLTARKRIVENTRKV